MFRTICRKPDYVDKTELIHEINQRIESGDKTRIVNSRPRRFGKSYTAAMLSAYYQSGHDSNKLFADKRIAAHPGWQQHLNQYNILYLDMNSFQGRAESYQRFLNETAHAEGQQPQQLRWITYLEMLIKQDIRNLIGGSSDNSMSLIDVLLNTVKQTGWKFIWICDEWDMFFREQMPDPHIADDYIAFLKTLFKAQEYMDIFAAAYMTGIMPMLKIKGQSAVSEFDNYTMFSPGPFAPFIGFTSDEVCNLCSKFNSDYEQMRLWYDGYLLYDQNMKRFDTYNPYAVTKALQEKMFTSFWSQSSSYELLMDRITQDIDGLHAAIMRMLGGDEITIGDTSRFTNRIMPFDNLDDELTLLVHLGYLTYNRETGSVRIPNKEIHTGFLLDMKDCLHKDVISLIQKSETILKAPWSYDEDLVGDSIEEIHRSIIDPKHYHNERDLTSVIRFAYLTAKDHSMEIFELPGGHGYADIVFIPRRGRSVPLMVVELKWNKPVNSALSQIKNKHYPEITKSHGGDVLLVGITYNPGTDIHECKIEKMTI